MSNLKRAYEYLQVNRIGYTTYGGTLYKVRITEKEMLPSVNQVAFLYDVWDVVGELVATRQVGTMKPESILDNIFYDH